MPAQSDIEALYVKGARVWIPDPETVWRPCRLAEDLNRDSDDVKVVFEREDESGSDSEDDDDEYNVVKFNLKKHGTPHLRNPDVLLAENDLTALSFLHEPAVLNSLKERFVHREQVYTYCGIVLVAINPYQACPIYDDTFIELYSTRDTAELDPHIYSIANSAFTNMTRFGKNQSIIVTGESGAGKTVSAKFSMKFFAQVGGTSSGPASGKDNVETKVLASNPIMEAIGNAKTTRNDNSSRFGKYIELDFDAKNRVTGAAMRTYLLEKSRVVRPGPNERNYHIFYQLVAAAQTDPQLASLHLKEVTEFTYLTAGECLEVDNVDDAKEFSETQYALTLLGVGSKEQSLILRVLAAILHIGNIEMTESGNDSASLDPAEKSLGIVCTLMGVESSQLCQWLIHRRIQTVTDVFDKPLRLEEAISARDSLAKFIYAQLFEMIVAQVNEALKTKSKCSNSIGVLDIYGFETFEVNSFEQFCINYANEKLQQQFCQHVFKLEQEEYQKEKLNWTKIEFYDNQPCIDLIEAKLGVLDLLDEECKMPKGSDDSWAMNLYNRHLKKHKNFDKPRTSNSAFIIKHFADDVTYQVEDFVSKNRDAVNQEQVSILKGSKFDLVAKLFQEKAAPATKKPARPGARSKNLKATVGRQFSDSLKSLMEKLNATTPHYVRCIKPNDEKAVFTFEPSRSVEQLRACGVLETVRLSAAGFPGRWSYKDFRTRYRVLLRGKEPKMEPRKACEAMLTRLIRDEDKYAFGKTKIFFRAGQVALMEKWRIDRLNHSAAIIQKFIKMFIYRRQYLKKRAIALKLQTAARAFLARKKLRGLQEQAAATKIQSWWKMTKARILFEKLRRGTIYVQSKIRQKFAMQAVYGLKREQAATVIQSVWRMYRARKLFLLNIRRVVRIQCLWRVKVARGRFRILRAEARDVNKMKSLNKGLENKIMELKRKSDDKAAKVKELEALLAKADKSSELNDEKAAEIVAQLGHVSNQRDELVKQAAEKDVRIQELEALLEEANRKTCVAQNQLEQSKSSKMELEVESDKLRQRAKTLDDDLLRLRSESELKVNEYKRQASAGTSDGAAELMSSQLLEKEQELSTLNQRYANLNDELQITRNRQADQMVEVTAKYDSLQVELTHVKEENAKLNAELTALTDAAEESGGADVVVVRKNELLMKDLEAMKEAQLAAQQKEAERKSRMRSTEMNTDEIDLTLIKALEAKVMNDQLEIGETKKKLYGQEMGSSEQVSELLGEISRLSNTNERLEKLCRKLNKKLRSAEKKANEFASQAGHSGSPLFPSSPSVRSFDDQDDTISVSEYESHQSPTPQTTSSRSWFGLGGKNQLSAKAEVDRQPKKASDGVLVFQARDLGSVVNAILESGNTIGNPRCGAAFLLFMALRHTDATNDDAMLKELLIAIINGLKRMGKKHSRSLPAISQWTCVAIRFTHLIYQYSGEADSSLMNDAQQNSHCLKNFDINEFRGFFSETATSLYKNTISLLQEKLKPLVVSAMLDHDSLHGNDAGKSIEDLIRELGTSLDLIASFGADDVVIKQICRQLIYYIVSIALNQLCARRDLCNWTKAMQLRYNVSQIEEYLSRREMRDKNMLRELSPLVQASQLMQVKKQDEKDADNLLAMCESLTGAQVHKLLQLITPVHEYEERVPSKFLSIIKTKISKNPGVIQRDLNYVAQPEFPYVPSSVKLNEIDVPSEVRKHTQLV